MPLLRGTSKKTRNRNIKEILGSFKLTGKIGTSHPANMRKAQAQAAAIAYDKQRRSLAAALKRRKRRS